jgi:hypothetical protein
MQRAQHPSHQWLSPVFSRAFSAQRRAAGGLATAVLIGVGVTALAVGQADAADFMTVDANLRAVNTICPVSGKKIDPTVEPVKATKNGRTVLIGADNAADAATIRANPGKYVDAALANRKADP